MTSSYFSLRTAMSNWIAILVAIVSLSGCGSTLPDVDDADPAIAATWYGGIHFLPGSATRTGEITEISFDNYDRNEWAQRIQDEVLKPGVRVPAVIYLHGAAGPNNAGGWAVDFAEFGYAFFAPDSYERPGRTNLGGTGQMHWRMLLRKQELRYALAQLRSIPWIDSTRLILAGYSEGAQTAANYSGPGFMAVMIFGTDCRFGGPNAPSDVPVLNVVGSRDELGYGGGCSFWRSVGGSRSVSISGLAHNVQGAPEVKAAMAEFLAACCGYLPPKMKPSISVEAMATKLVSEIGDLATMDALMKASDSQALGDDEAYEYWMSVRDRAYQLLVQ